MKKYLRYLLYGVVAVTLFAAWGCSDDDDNKTIEQEITLNQLPDASRSFLSEYFSGDKAVRVIHDFTDTPATYEVYLASGAKIEFDNSGNWKDVEMPYGKTVPAGIIPPKISAYLAQNYPNVGVHEISVDSRGYDVELDNGIDLLFDTLGIFIGIDR